MKQITLRKENEMGECMRIDKNFKGLEKLENEIIFKRRNKNR